jgi:hypothetical protein
VRIDGPKLDSAPAGARDLRKRRSGLGFSTPARSSPVKDISLAGPDAD